LDWHEVHDTVDLLALRMEQLKDRDANTDQASKDLAAQRKRNADAYWEKYGREQYKEAILPGTMVLVYKSFLDNQQGNKGATRWFGPYYVVEVRPSGAYILAELDGTVISKPVAAQRVKIFYFRDNDKPMLHKRIPEKEGRWKVIEDWHRGRQEILEKKEDENRAVDEQEVESEGVDEVSEGEEEYDMLGGENGWFL
jgi:hypothetical protein